jgi:hypothetical protein
MAMEHLIVDTGAIIRGQGYGFHKVAKVINLQILCLLLCAILTPFVELTYVAILDLRRSSG